MFDIKLKLKDKGSVTASGYGTVDGSAQVLNLGLGLVRGNMILDVTRLEISDNDELVRVHLMGGSDGSFTNEVSLVSLELGAKEVIEGNIDSEQAARFILPFQNEQAGTVYPYVRVRHEISGTSPRINYQARLEKDLPITGRLIQTTTTTTTTTTT